MSHLAASLATRGPVVWLPVILLCGISAAAVRAEDWPHWRGPQRNGVTGESSAWEQQAWNRLKQLWRRDVGQGSSSPLIAQGCVFTLGWSAGQDHVHCLEASTGQVLWKQSYKSPQYGRYSEGDQGLYAGATSTPEFDPETGFLYTLGIDGELRCWDSKSQGQLIWRRGLYDEFNVPKRPKVGRSGRRDYGYTSSPLIHGPWLIVEVGTATGSLVGFDKRSGQTRWQSQSKSPAGHNGGPVPIEVEGVPCVAVHNFDGLLVARLDAGREGQTVATYDWKTEFANNIATPAVYQDSVVLTSHYNHQKVARLRITLSGTTKVWQQAMASKVCSPVIYEGHIYWAWQQVVCLDFETGRLRWQGGQIGDAGSCIATADGRLIVWSGRGTLSLVETARHAPSRYTELASQRLLSKTDAWPHVALADGRLYCKDRGGELVCIELQ